MDRITLEITREEQQVLVMGIAAYIDNFKRAGVLSMEGETALKELQQRIRETNTGS